jgi:AcrR family transcriptional regulator
MRRKGYAATSLSDLAKEAGLSVSHLLYFFSSKQAVLHELHGGIQRSMLSDVMSHRDDTPEERCHALADYFFAGHVIEDSDLALVFDLLAQTPHIPDLRATNREFQTAMTEYLADLFGQTPRAAGLNPEDAAFLAAAIWHGLLAMSYFDERLNRSYATRLFRWTLLRIGGLAAGPVHVQPPPLMNRGERPGAKNGRAVKAVGSPTSGL